MVRGERSITNFWEKSCFFPFCFSRFFPFCFSSIFFFLCTSFCSHLSSSFFIYSFSMEVMKFLVDSSLRVIETSDYHKVGLVSVIFNSNCKLNLWSY